MVSRANANDVGNAQDELLAHAADEYFAAAKRGERPSITEFVERYPAIAADIRLIFPAMALVCDSITSAASGGQSFQFDAHGQLGDYRLVRELGRGGMGVVFEAEQISMGRRVALKVLPFAALAHDKALQRFHNEVRAAAALDHPNIVSVYAVGEERGVHYYAMQLVRGQTLADVIHQMRVQRDPDRGVTPLGNENPTIDSAVAAPLSTKRDEQARISTAVDARRDAERRRTAARLGIQAAEALQHAHDQGVLHRDVKPGNLLLDADGRLYVADFGLARIEADAGMTMTGDIVGTLRYMAPEQALAKRVVIDHRADVYSLGATLYELLTLVPPFGESDRSELLKQIAFTEPTPLRKLDRHIPAELDTIVLKAMAKNPDERYQSAQQLADDLRAMLESRPILAKPPTIANRVAKWSRRHVGLVWSAAIGLLLATAGLTASTIFIARERAEAVAARDDALGYFELAREAVDGLMTRVADEHLLDTPRTEQLRTRLYEDALAYYEKLLSRKADSPELQLEAALAQQRVSRILMDLDRRRAGWAAHTQVIERLSALAQQFPDVPDYQFQLASALTMQGVHAQSVSYIGANDATGEGPIADGPSPQICLDRAIALLDELVATYPEPPQYRSQLAKALYVRFGFYLAENPAKNEVQASTLGKPIAELQRALSLMEPLLDRPDPQATDLHTMTDTLRFLSILSKQAGQDDVAKPASARAVEYGRRLVEAYPADPKYRFVLAGALFNALNLYPPEDHSAHQQLREEAVKLLAGLAKDFPSNPKYSSHLAKARAALGDCLCDAQDYDAGEAQYRQAIDLLASLRQEFPAHAEYFTNLLRVYARLMAMHQTRHDDEKLLAVLDELKPIALNAASQLEDRYELVAATIDFHSTEPLLRQNRDDEAVDAVRQGWDRCQRVLGRIRMVSLAESGLLYARLACTALHDAGHSDVALEYTRKLVDLHRQRADADDSEANSSRSLLADLLVTAPQVELRDLAEAGRLDPARFGSPQLIGDRYAVLGRYAEAAEQYLLAIEDAPADSGVLVRAACLLLASGDRGGYETMCRQMLEQFGATDDPVAARRTCWASAISPQTVGGMDELIRLAEFAFGDTNTPYLAARERGLAAYRANDWQAALKWCAKSREIDPRTGNKVSKPINWLIEAMALHRLSKPTEAKRSFDEAVAMAPESIPGADWIEWVYYQQIRREAEELLQTHK